jgi:hypothetical protein
VAVGSSPHTDSGGQGVWVIARDPLPSFGEGLAGLQEHRNVNKMIARAKIFFIVHLDVGFVCKKYLLPKRTLLSLIRQ